MQSSIRDQSWMLIHHKTKNKALKWVCSVVLQAMIEEKHKTPSPDFAVEQEMEELKGEIHALEGKVEDLEKQLNNKGQTVKEMSKSLLADNRN